MNAQSNETPAAASAAGAPAPETGQERRDRFRAWMRRVDDALHEYTGAPADYLPDDPRFTWWAWFDGALEPEAAAAAAVDIITSTEAPRFDPVWQRAPKDWEVSAGALQEPVPGPAVSWERAAAARDSLARLELEPREREAEADGE